MAEATTEAAPAPVKPKAKASKNADGSIIVTLGTEIEAKVGERTEKAAKVTIPALKGKHMKLLPNMSHPTIGEAVLFASLVIEPPWAVDEMTPEDALFCALEVRNAYYKSSE